MAFNSAHSKNARTLNTVLVVLTSVGGPQCFRVDTKIRIQSYCILHYTTTNTSRQIIFSRTPPWKCVVYLNDPSYGNSIATKVNKYTCTRTHINTYTHVHTHIHTLDIYKRNKRFAPLIPSLYLFVIISPGLDIDTSQMRIFLHQNFLRVSVEYVWWYQPHKSQPKRTTLKGFGMGFSLQTTLILKVLKWLPTIKWLRFNLKKKKKILRGKMLMIQKLKCVELVLFYKRANLATNGTSIESADSTPWSLSTRAKWKAEYEETSSASECTVEGGKTQTNTHISTPHIHNWNKLLLVKAFVGVSAGCLVVVIFEYNKNGDWNVHILRTTTLIWLFNIKLKSCQPH